jgi:hypothetical protein
MVSALRNSVIKVDSWTTEFAFGEFKSFPCRLNASMFGIAEQRKTRAVTSAIALMKKRVDS